MASSPTRPADPSRRRGKFRDLVNSCHAMLETAGLRTPVAELEQRLADQISMVAAQTGISEQTALRTYFDTGWAQSTTARLVADAAAGLELDTHDLAPQQRVELATSEVLGVIAALGQAQLCDAVNRVPLPPVRPDTTPGADPSTDMSLVPTRRPPRARIRRPGVRYDPVAAAEATTTLALAVAADPPARAVAVELDALRRAHRVLTAFVEHLDHGRWLVCHCCPADEQTEKIAELRARVILDAAHLEHAVKTAAAAAATAPMGKVLPLRRPKHRRTPPALTD